MKQTTINALFHKAAKLYPLAVPSLTVQEAADEMTYIAENSKTKSEASKMIYDFLNESHNYFTEAEISLDEFTLHLLNNH